ncbi:hypothetical protein EP18_14780 [Lysinibacillus sphaericus]|nr:anti sigma factor C-terminal domain-containing protein [Lysinibacillus sphaericus]KEK10909.1 hypothetical protein EP18_14780 [Lysinibacillus sphaericus]
MNDDEILDDLFEFNNESKIVKKAKRSSYIRMISISGFVTAAVVILVIILKLQITPYLINKEILAKEAFYKVHGANTYLSPWNTKIKLIGSTATSTQYKLLNGRPIFKNEITLDSTSIETYVQPNPNKTFNYFGQNIINFYHPKIAYDQVAHDILSLNSSNENQLVEMGISFDQAYSMNAVKKMLPEDLTIQWYWLDTFSTDEISNMQKSDQPYSKIPPYVFKEDEVVGIKAFSNTGEKYDDSLEEFVESIKFAMKNNSDLKNEMQDILDLITSNGEIQTDKVQIIGAVVVGDVEKLTKISTSSFIRATSRGASTDAY